MRITIRGMCQKRDDLDEQILHYRSELCKTCPAILVQSTRAEIQEVSSKLFNKLHQIKAQKLQQLIHLETKTIFFTWRNHSEVTLKNKQFAKL